MEKKDDLSFWSWGGGKTENERGRWKTSEGRVIHIRKRARGGSQVARGGQYGHAGYQLRVRCSAAEYVRMGLVLVWLRPRSSSVWRRKNELRQLKFLWRCSVPCSYMYSASCVCSDLLPTGTGTVPYHKSSIRLGLDPGPPPEPQNKEQRSVAVNGWMKAWMGLLSAVHVPGFPYTDP